MFFPKALLRHVLGFELKNGRKHGWNFSCPPRAQPCKNGSIYLREVRWRDWMEVCSFSLPNLEKVLPSLPGKWEEVKRVLEEDA